MKQILAFGDSNTWGLIPGTWDRYPEYVRWTGILRKAVVSKGRRILEDGLVGRTTVFDDPARPLRRGIDSIPRYREEKDLDAVILMLGTNDCKNVFRPTPEKSEKAWSSVWTVLKPLSLPKKYSFSPRFCWEKTFGVRKKILRSVRNPFRSAVV